MLDVQEVTDSIFALLRSAPWMRQYEAIPAGGQAYYTALLYKKSAVTGAQPCRLHRFPGSMMGASLGQLLPRALMKQQCSKKNRTVLATVSMPLLPLETLE